MARTMTWYSVSIIALLIAAENLVLTERDELLPSNYLGEFHFFAASSCQQMYNIDLKHLRRTIG